MVQTTVLGLVTLALSSYGSEVYRFLWRLDSLIFIFLSLVVLNASRQRGLCCERVTYFFKLDRVLVSQR